MSLLRQIQDAATDSMVDICSVLRKAKILAARLRNPEVEAWIDSELNGYDSPSCVPAYRVVPAVVKGNLAHPYQQWNNAPIMTSFLPEEFSAWAGPCRLAQSISRLGALAASAEQGELHSPWPQELAVKYGSMGYKGWQCLGAWQVITRPALVGVIEQVRNRVLDFVLKLEAIAPDAGETSVGREASISRETVTQIFHTHVYGHTNNIATGSPHTNQAITSGLQHGDLAALVAQLRGIGIAQEDVKALERAVTTEPDVRKAAESWLGKLALNTATGATTAAFGLAAKAVAAHFGLHVS